MKTILLNTIFVILLMVAPAVASEVTLAWDASEDPAVIGYYIYWGLVSGNFGVKEATGDTTVYTVQNLVPGHTYKFAATAHDNDGNESAFSNQVEYKVPTDDGPVLGDIDGDGFYIVHDCDDNDPEVNPSMSEIKNNNKDDDCNPETLDNNIAPKEPVNDLKIIE